MTTSSASRYLVLLALGACGVDSASTPEMVVADAALGRGVPAVVGATSDAVYWTVAQANTTRLVLGGSLGTLPTTGDELGEAAGAVTQIGDHVVFTTTKSVARAGVGVSKAEVASVMPDAAGERPDGTFVWFAGGQLEWGARAMEGFASSRFSRANAIAAGAKRTYVAGTIGTSTEWRLMRLESGSDRSENVATSSEFGARFPGGAIQNAQYRGKLVGADDAAALWLVMETPDDASTASRAILVSLPVEGEPSILLDRIGAVSAFIATPDGFYWQEGDAVLHAPKSGGAASIEAHITGQAGAVADGYVYYVNGNAIERIAVD